MLHVDIVPIQDTLVLRARGSELLILPNHVAELKKRKAPKDFSAYFLGEALINRPARKLFEAWLRKDNSLWPRVYKTIQEEMKLEETPEQENTEQEDAKVINGAAKAISEKDGDKKVTSTKTSSIKDDHSPQKADGKKDTKKVADKEAKKTDKEKTQIKKVVAKEQKKPEKIRASDTKKKPTPKARKKG